MKRVKTEIIDRQAFMTEFARTNKKRSGIAVVVFLTIATMMFFSQWQSMNYNSDLIMRERSETLFLLASFWFVVAIITALIYQFFIRNSMNYKLIQTFTYTYFALYIIWGFTSNLLVFLMDNETFLSYFIIFIFFSSLIFLVKPLASFAIILSIDIISIASYYYLPLYYNVPQMDNYNWLIYLETLSIASVLAFVITVLLYRNFIQDFNKNYTIKGLNKELTYHLKMDSLTEIFNRREFTRLLSEAKEGLIERQDWVTIGVVDIDYFKQYNDTYGHLEGDHCLHEVAQCIQNTVCSKYENASVARFGGEEFVFYIPEHSPENVASLFPEITDKITELNIEHKGSLISDTLTVSVGGCTTIPYEGCDLHQIVNLADMLLYEAKKDGRNKVVYNQIDSLDLKSK